MDDTQNTEFLDATADAGADTTADSGGAAGTLPGADSGNVPSGEAKTGSMLDAISEAVGDESNDGEKPDDGNAEKGEAAAADKPSAGPDGTKADQQDDLTQMPEGLSAKAQERFQKLANANKEKTAELERMTNVIEPFRQSLQDNGVTQDQFTLATSYIGLINKGDFKGALAIMDEERRQIALLAGMPLEGVDALQEFPDLRDAVDTFQITEKHAMELAKQRKVQSVNQLREQQVSQQRAAQSNAEQLHQRGLQDVDAFCKDMEKTDLDFKHIEAILLPQIESGLLNGIPPARWRSIVEAQYRAIKAATASNKQSSPGFKSLRPAGSDSSPAKPKSMFQAMFGGE